MAKPCLVKPWKSTMPTKRNIWTNFKVMTKNKKIAIIIAFRDFRDEECFKIYVDGFATDAIDTGVKMTPTAADSSARTVDVAISNTPTVGAGNVYVTYTVPVT